MPRFVTCPTCSGPMRLPDEWAGKKVRCPSCKETFLAPAAPTAEPRQPAPAPDYTDLPLQLSLDDPDGPSSSPAAPTHSTQGFGFVELSLNADEPVRAAPAPTTHPAARPTVHQPPRQPPRLSQEDDDLRDCPACGESVGVRARHCPYCGKRLRGRGPSGPWDEGPPRYDWEPERGSFVLTLGTLSLVCLLVVCWPVGAILGITSWVMGQKDLAQMRANRMDPDGYNLTQAGWVCGIIGTALNGAIMLLILLAILSSIAR